jgi:hypothetical protein
MKRRIVTLLLPIVILLSFTSVNWAGDFTFRKTNWGMSKYDVKVSESLNVEEENNSGITYRTKVLGKNVMLAYFFDDNKLTSALYILNECYTDDYDYIKDHALFQKNLREKYGEEKTETIDKKDIPTSILTDPDAEIRMIKEGYMQIHSSWKTHSTKIKLIINSNNNKIVSSIYYEPIPDL